MKGLRRVRERSALDGVITPTSPRAGRTQTRRSPSTCVYTRRLWTNRVRTQLRPRHQGLGKRKHAGALSVCGAAPGHVVGGWDERGYAEAPRRARRQRLLLARPSYTHRFASCFFPCAVLHPATSSGTEANAGTPKPLGVRGASSRSWGNQAVHTYLRHASLYLVK